MTMLLAVEQIGKLLGCILHILYVWMGHYGMGVEILV